MVKLLARMRWYYWVIILLIGILLYWQTSLELMLPEYMAQIIVEISNYKNIPEYSLNINFIWLTGLKMVSIIAIAMLGSIIVGYLSARIAAGFSSDLRRDIFKKVEGFSLEELNGFSTSSLITRTTNDVVQIQMVVIMVIRLAFTGPITGVLSIVKAVEQSRDLSFLILFVVLFLVVSVATIFIIVIPRFSRMQKYTDKLNLVTRENLTGLRVVRASNAEKIEEAKFEEVNRDFTKNNIFVNRVGSLMNPIMQLALNGMTLSIVWLGAYLLNDFADLEIRSAYLGSILEFQQYAVMVVFSFMMITMLVIFVPRGIVSGRRIQEIFAMTDRVVDPVVPVNAFEEVGTIEFRQVTFSYPDADEPVVQDISFKVSRGETIAFIGSTGSGKSTIINLIPRFFDATKGEVLVDGINVKEISQKSLRNKIGYVPQKGVLFRGTIKSNLTYGNSRATDEEIEEALEIAQAKDFVSKLPEGIDSPIAQGGTNVSGGQKQRLSIARAVIKKPEIYIFDDSFSALDFKTERVLRDRLEEATQGSTKVIVAQRVGSIMNADQIVVLEQGKIAGIGKHQELLKTCEVYKEIALSQLKKEELE